jgi:hypothetical protein
LVTLVVLAAHILAVVRVAVVVLVALAVLRVTLAALARRTHLEQGLT